MGRRETRFSKCQGLDSVLNILDSSYLGKPHAFGKRSTRVYCKQIYKNMSSTWYEVSKYLPYERTQCGFSGGFRNTLKLTSN